MMTKASGAKVPTTISISPDLRAQVDALAARSDRSRSWIAEAAIRHFLQQAAPSERGASTAEFLAKV